MIYPDTRFPTPMSQPALHAYLTNFRLPQRDLEDTMAAFHSNGQRTALRFAHEAMRQRRRTDYLRVQAARLLQEMVRGRDVRPVDTSALVDASLKAAGEMSDALEPRAES